jgi:hypothetical protein
MQGETSTVKARRQAFRMALGPVPRRLTVEDSTHRFGTDVREHASAPPSSVALP